MNYNLCMSKTVRLSSEDKEFLRILVDFAFSNPFEKQSLELAYKIAGGFYPAGEELSRHVFESVKSIIDRVTSNGRFNWKHFSGGDKELVRVALLHDSYYRCYVDFDHLIRNQVQDGYEETSVSFAKESLLVLRKRGFSVADSLRYFSFYYQLRRAWYFINHGLIGQSNSMEVLRSHLWRSVFTSFPGLYEQIMWNRMEDFSTFLVGETGTGKGTAAAAIGQSGFIPFLEKKNRFAESFSNNFIQINLSQFSEAIIESELFGHCKGAFTGAVDHHQGIFSRCSPHGSIFLDEIGDVSIPIQIKLLKVLEERTFAAVGGHEKLQFEGRIITATNKPLIELKQQNIFREDFYYRLCSNVIHVPTLRQQISEDPSTLTALLDHTIHRITGESLPVLLDQVLDILDKEIGMDYDWPGNVRELEQAVRSILLTKHYTRNRREAVEYELNFHQEIDAESLDAQRLVSVYCSILYEKYGTYEKVARITNLDPRTVKKHIADA